MVRLSHLISFFVLSRFFLFFFSDSLLVCVCLGVLQENLKTKKKKKGNQENFIVALIKLYPFHNTIINTYTHKVVVLCFE